MKVEKSHWKKQIYNKDNGSITCKANMTVKKTKVVKITKIIIFD